MNSNVFFSADYSNNDVSGLIDRIINIKFTRKNGETFTLRSDYEPVWNDGKLSFVTCQPKPEIRVQYTQYQATMINVDIYVTNLNILEEASPATVDKSMINAAVNAVKTGKKNPDSPGEKTESILTRLGNVVTKAEIEMGYRGTFYNWASNTTNSAEDYENFLNLSLPGGEKGSEQIVNSQLFFNAQRRCTVTIEWAANMNNPPDRVTQFHGYVGATEAGFQPLSLQSLDCNSEAGTVGSIRQQEIYEGLDDEHNKIDEVSVDVIKKEKGGTPEFLILNKRGSRTVFRNFFNGGKGFTLLEGYCFHLITRRFVRSDVPVKRNSLLEQAALEYALAINYVDISEQLTIKGTKDSVTQEVYRLEQPFNKTYFVRKGVELELSTTIDTPEFKEFKLYIETSITKLLVELYVGVRFTIKNLPEYRKLYTSIRQTLKKSAEKGEYKSWWEAASELSKSELKTSTAFFTSSSARKPKDRSENFVENKIEAVRQYTLALEKGTLNFEDSYFSTEKNGEEWIIPLQSISSSVKLKNSRGGDVEFRPPTEVTKDGFGKPGGKIPVRCFTGLFEVRDAYMLGVPVLCSEKASRIFEKAHESSAPVTMEFKSDPQTQIEWICKRWGLKYYKLHNGGFYIYSPAETARDVASQPIVTSQSNKPFRIPAIYDMAITPSRKIRMPFVSFLNPMTLVEWNSSNTIGSMISFYYQPGKGKNFFMIIRNTVDFCTVGDFNNMELELIDTQWVDKLDVPLKVVNPDKNQKGIYIDTIIFPDKDMDTWEKIYNSHAGKIPTSLIPQWEESLNIEEQLSPDDRVSPKQFFTLLEKWNQTLFDLAKEGTLGWAWGDWFDRIDKNANKKYGNSRPEKKNFPGIEYCFNELEDPKLKRIYMKFPFMPSEADYTESYDNAYVLVYESGTWSTKLKTDYSTNFTIGEG